MRLLPGKALKLVIVGRESNGRSRLERLINVGKGGKQKKTNKITSS